MTTPLLVTIPDVEIATVGEDWPASTGPLTLTVEMLQSAVAAQDDPGIRTGVLKLGHCDPRFDGQPAVGRVTNLRLTDDDHTLVCDLTGVPAWMAESDDAGNTIMGSAFPSRSLEGFLEFKSSTGNTWPLVITGLALLGVQAPAIESLADIAALYGAAPEALEIAASGTILPGQVRQPLEVRMAKKVDFAGIAKRLEMSGVRVDDVRKAYYDSLGTAEMWWWIRSMYIDPPELIVDDDDGALFRVGFTINTDGTVEFADPIEVKIEYVNVAASQRTAAMAFAMRTASRPDAVRASTTATQPGGSVTPEQIREALGLATDATDQQVTDRLDALKALEPDVTDTPVTPVVTPSATAPVVTTDTSAPETLPLAASADDGIIKIDKTAYDRLMAGAALSEKHEKEAKASHRDAVLSAAIKAGKFAPARKAHFSALFDADPEGTEATIKSLAKGIVPVTEVGMSGNPTGGDEHGENGEDAYPADWLPEVVRTPIAAGKAV